jgi:hypothetical protein
MNLPLRSKQPPADLAWWQRGEQPSFRHDFAQSIVRAAVAHGLARINKEISPVEHAAHMWPNDADVQLVLRAASPPADMTSAAALVQITLAILPLLQGFSAATVLFGRGLTVTLGRGAVTVPNIGPVGVGFVAGGAPKPVLQGTSVGSRLDPHKIAGITVLSSELYQQGSVEPVIRQLLGESAGPALDAVVFSNQAATAAQPAGLLNGIVALTAAAAGGDPFVEDIKTLATAVGPVAGAGNITYIANPGQVEAARYHIPGIDPSYAPWIASSQVPAGTIVAVANNAVVSALGAPEFESSVEATLQMDNAPSTLMAGPTQSMWQTASIAVKLYFPVTWALRSPQGAAWIQNVNW